MDNLNHLPCRPGVAGLVPGITSLSDETLSQGPVSMTSAVGGTLTQIQQQQFHVVFRKSDNKSELHVKAINYKLILPHSGF